MNYYKVYINGIYITSLYKALAYDFAKIADVSTTTIITEGIEDISVTTLNENERNLLIALVNYFDNY